jgi:predicted metal-dependent enzyme (double-stranded beta helix superfamily)
MPHPALQSFIARMDELVGAERDPAVIAVRTGAYLAELLEQPSFLEPHHRQPAQDGYRQHVVHVHPEGHYSLVALVWLPGQATPIHDHRCWCVVGVLQGREYEERFTLHDAEAAEWLRPRQHHVYEVGQVCTLVPPEEDIHRVGNVGDGPTISLHVYGADIAACGSSINRIFDLPVRDVAEPDGGPVSWRVREQVTGLAQHTTT